MIENKNIESSQKVEPEEFTGIIDKKNSSKKYELIKYPENNNMPILEDPIDSLLYNINNYALLLNKVDFYGNSIPLGAFYCAISFIMYGFYECNIHKNNDKFLYIILLLFGGCGKIISNILNILKEEHFDRIYIFYMEYIIYVFF